MVEKKEGKRSYTILESTGNENSITEPNIQRTHSDADIGLSNKKE